MNHDVEGINTQYVNVLLRLAYFTCINFTGEAKCGRKYEQSRKTVACVGFVFFLLVEFAGRAG